MNTWYSIKERDTVQRQSDSELTMQVLSMEPVNIREQSQLNKALLISAQWPIKVCTFLQDRNRHSWWETSWFHFWFCDKPPWRKWYKGVRDYSAHHFREAKAGLRQLVTSQREARTPHSPCCLLGSASAQLAFFTRNSSGPSPGNGTAHTQDGSF